MQTHIPHEWGLRQDVTPRFGARLVQEGNHLHFLADRASIIGTFTPEQLNTLDQHFQALMKQLEALLKTGELNPHQSHRVMKTFGGLICEVDTLGSCGYVYLSVYPEYTATL